MENGHGGSIRCCRPFPVLRVVERILVCENDLLPRLKKCRYDKNGLKTTVPRPPGTHSAGHFLGPKYSIKFKIPDRIQKIAMTTKTIRQPVDTSATKRKAYRAKTLKIRQKMVVMTFTFVRLSKRNPPLSGFDISIVFCKYEQFNEEGEMMDNEFGKVGKRRRCKGGACQTHFLKRKAR